ncbi:hypothetical protein DL95DRAFT_401789 [Leptodontidium sp. 2 PMI_412]|nr:hypothetical protein DL95DRAFT_401789 [Leptodontidium sp. 2 PMI_412]
MANKYEIEYLSKPIEARMTVYWCFCANCDDMMPATECFRVDRLSEHSKNVNQLLLNCPDIVTLLVGPGESKLTCHKSLLGFTSEFFDAALYGQFEESQTNIIRLPNETPEAIAGFLTWTYTGHIESSTSAEELWALGDRLLSPLFMNEVMRLIFAIYGRHEHWLCARGADHAFNETAPGSKLRKFVCDYIDYHGPLCPQAIRDDDNEDGLYERDWRALIEKGGELVSYMALGNGAKYKPVDWPQDGFYPTLTNLKQGEYMLDVKTRDIEDFILGKMRAG